MTTQRPGEPPQNCTSCGHDWEAHDVPDWFDDEPPNPLACPVEGCGCRDVTPTPDELIDARMSAEKS